MTGRSEASGRGQKSIDGRDDRFARRPAPPMPTSPQASCFIDRRDDAQRLAAVVDLGDQLLIVEVAGDVPRRHRRRWRGGAGA